MSLTGKLAMMSKGLFSQGQTGAAKITEQARASIILQGIQIAKQQEEIADYREILLKISEFQKQIDGGANVHGGVAGLFGVVSLIDDVLAKHNKGE